MIGRTAHLLRIQPPVVDNRGLLWGSGATVPADNTDGWQTGAIWQKTNGGVGTALYINEGSVTSCAFNAVEGLESISIADLVDVADGFATRLLETGTYANTASAGVVLSATNTRPVAILTDDGGANLDSGNYRPLLSRTLLTIDQTGSTITPVRGQLKLNNLIDVGTGIYAPVQGYIEVAGTSIANSGATLSCISASLEITTALTAASGGEVAGVHIETTGAGTLTATGTVAGLLIDKASGAADWPYGAILKNSTIGLAITGATTVAVDIQTSGVFRMGVQDTGIDVTTTYPFAMEVQCEANADIVAGDTGSSAGFYTRYAIETAQTSNTAHIGVFGKLRVKADLGEGNHAGVMGWVEISGTTEIGGSATTQTSAGTFSIIAATGLNLSTGYLNGILIDSSIATGATTTGVTAAARVKVSASCDAWDYGLILENSSTVIGVSIGTCTTGITIGACTTGVNFSGICTKNITMGTTGGSGATTALGTLSSSWYGIEISVSANLATKEAHAIRAEIETTAGTAGNMMVARFDACASHSVNTLNGINATAQLLGDATLGGRVAAGYISLYGAGSKTLTRTNNSIYGLFVQHLLYSDPGDAPGDGDPEPGDFYNAAIGVSMPGATYCDYGLVLKGETSNLTAAILIAPIGTSVWPYGILFSEGTPSSGATPSVTTALYFDSSCSYTNFAGWEAASGAISVVTADVSGTSTSHALKIDIAGVAHYIPVYNTTSW